jgi:hypothetical protein
VETGTIERFENEVAALCCGRAEFCTRVSVCDCLQSSNSFVVIVVAKVSNLFVAIEPIRAAVDCFRNSCGCGGRGCDCCTIVGSNVRAEIDFVDQIRL